MNSKALNLAKWLDKCIGIKHSQAANEIRRLVEENEKLKETLVDVAMVKSLMVTDSKAFLKETTNKKLDKVNQKVYSAFN